MATGYYLTEDQLREHKEVWDYYTKHLRSKRSQIRSIPNFQSPSPEIYVAQTPTDGIPGRVSDNPGSANCIIWQIVDSGEDNYQLLSLEDSEKLVYNLSTSAVAGSDWVLVVKDKLGCWIAVVATSSPATSTTFQIVAGSILDNNFTALANPTTFNTTTLKEYDPTAFDENGTPQLPQITEDTVIVADAYEQIIAFVGDFIKAEDTGVKKWCDDEGVIQPDAGTGGDYTEREVWKISTKISAQTGWSGTMAELLMHGATTPSQCEITVNGISYLVDVWADLLAEGDYLQIGDLAWVTYRTDARRFVVTATPCYPAV